MPVTATFHTSTVSSPPRSPPKFGTFKTYVPPAKDPAAEEHASKLNELLNLRSKNISSIIAGEVPAPNPRAAELHAELGIDKVVLVKSPFVIDTTPGGFHDPNASVASASSGGKGLSLIHI